MRVDWLTLQRPIQGTGPGSVWLQWRSGAKRGNEEASRWPGYFPSTSGCHATSSGAEGPCTPASGRRRCRAVGVVERLNVEGDGQGDLGGHGGEQRAVFVYQIESYRYWEERLGRGDFTHGQFGENFTVEGLPDDEVCIGDRYRIGTALFEVTQPRTTCYRVGIRMDEPRMAALLTSSGRPGFYLRVLEEGEVGAGDEILPIAQARSA